MEFKVDYDIDPKKDLEIHDLNQECIRQASKFAMWAVAAVESQKTLDDDKTGLKVLEARLHKNIKDAAALSGTKITEKSIEVAIINDPKWQKYSKCLNDAKKDVSFLYAIKEAFSQRKDILVALSYNEREERKANIVMRDKV